MEAKCPWKGQHGEKRIIKEFRHVQALLQAGTLPQLSDLMMHKVRRWVDGACSQRSAGAKNGFCLSKSDKNRQ